MVPVQVVSYSTTKGNSKKGNSWFNYMHSCMHSTVQYSTVQHSIIYGYIVVVGIVYIRWAVALYIPVYDDMHAKMVSPQISFPPAAFLLLAPLVGYMGYRNRYYSCSGTAAAVISSVSQSVSQSVGQVNSFLL